MTVSRRDFLRLRTTEQGRILDVSCQMLFMRCSDASIEIPSPEDYEQSVGEPPAVLTRRTTEEIFDSLERELLGVQVLRLLDPEWLENISAGKRMSDIIAAFHARGGRVERAGRAGT